MIKAIFNSKEGEKDILFIGLSELNTQKLKEGMPILFELEGVSHRIAISYGKTEEHIKKDLMRAYPDNFDSNGDFKK